MTTRGDLAVAATRNGTRIELRVMPRASRTRIEGPRDGRLVVRVTAPPVDSAANEAVIELLASWLDVSKRSVRVVAGLTSKNKTVEIEGLAVAAVLSAVGTIGPG